MYFLLAFLALNFIIMFHEWGHMMAAKSCGVGVVEYSIGMGPCLWTKRVKETVYSIRLFPIGGYCSMYGEDSIESIDPVKPKERWYAQYLPKPDYKTDFTEEQMYNHKPWYQQVFMLFAGPLANFVLAWVLSFIVIVAIGTTGTATILELAEDIPIAKEAGLEAGDTIIQVNGYRVRFWKDYKSYADLHREYNKAHGYEITVEKPSGEIYITRLQPNEDGLVGIVLNNKRQPVSIGTAFLTAHRELSYYIRMTVEGLRAMWNKEYGLKDMSGVVGATQIMGDRTSEAVQDGGFSNGLVILMQMVVLLSANIGVMNLIPFPVLDGGRIVTVLIEAVAHRRMSMKTRYALEATCMLILLTFTLTIMLKDAYQILSQYWSG